MESGVCMDVGCWSKVVQRVRLSMNLLLPARLPVTYTSLSSFGQLRYSAPAKVLLDIQSRSASEHA